MPVVIGAKPQANFTDPIGLLTDCHRRIERFLTVLVQVAEQAAGGPLTAEQRTALDTALRYFREAAPKHTAGEEETLFPRLRQSERPEVQEVLSRVESLERDHARANESHAEVDRLGQEWLSAGTLRSADAARVSLLLAELAELYRGHIAVEEEQVFPIAGRVLDARERQAIAGEMAARRGLAGERR
jgi:hemerythrin-like domain-containing protein